MTRPHTALVARLLAGLLVLAVALLGPSAVKAFAAESVDTYAVEGSIGTDGALVVNATITFDGAAPATLVQKFATTREVMGDREYVYTLQDIKVTAGGQPLNATIANEAAQTVVTMPTQGVTSPIVLSYVVTGAAIKEATGETTVNWRLLQGLSLPVKQFTAVLTVPTTIALVQCNACLLYTSDAADE